MNDLGPPPSAPAPARPDPPASYRAGGLIPPPGTARTWGLTVIGVPLLIVLLLGLVDGSFSAGGGGAQAQPWTAPTASYTYTGSVEASPYGASDPVSTPDSVTTTGPARTDEANPTDQATPTGIATATAVAPEAAVTAYFAAINNRDYSTAWALGGKNLGDADYDAFVAGYATTERDTISQVSVQGNVVTLVLNAHQTDGTSHAYNAAYTVLDGVITQGTATPIG
ncbi:hypothetical protein SAMN05216489_05660 [Streptomyces sp. 3213]|uniref:hypothetical protein n=1 Tax=Streptomyces sp. 3213.3 TaxID=1855348 RepID=UPI0008983F1F|nr:hypothetical protein [Streptomyces sp. 3213.3]SEE14910.1 hypothetical protein SAMN05216489_05660 [Streptomyces sp. 3213] [Streptomyces sp. 3213.3]